MKCYRVNCECDDIKKTYCLFKVTEQQQRLIARLKDNCIVCNSRTVASKFEGIDTRLCTSCGTVAIDDVVVRSCLINSRRVG